VSKDGQIMPLSDDVNNREEAIEAAKKLLNKEVKEWKIKKF